MPKDKLTIVPVTLLPEKRCKSSETSLTIGSSIICTIKTANAEVAFHTGIDEHIIQIIMRELKYG